MQIEPQNLQAWASRGLAYERLGDKEKAAGSYAKALNINDKYEPAQSGLRPRRRQGRADRIRRSSDAASRLSETDPDCGPRRIADFAELDTGLPRPVYPLPSHPYEGSAHDHHAQSHDRSGPRQGGGGQVLRPISSGSSADAPSYFAPVRINKSLTLLFDDDAKFESHHLRFPCQRPRVRRDLRPHQEGQDHFRQRALESRRRQAQRLGRRPRALFPRSRRARAGNHDRPAMIAALPVSRV